MNLPRLFCLVQARQQHHHRDTLGAPVPRKVLSLTSALKHSARANSRTFKGTLTSSCHLLLIACDSHSSAEQRPPREPASSIFARWQRLRLEVCFLSLLRSTSSSWPLTRLVKPSDIILPRKSRHSADLQPGRLVLLLRLCRFRQVPWKWLKVRTDFAVRCSAGTELSCIAKRSNACSKCRCPATLSGLLTSFGASLRRAGSPIVPVPTAPPSKFPHTDTNQS